METGQHQAAERSTDPSSRDKLIRLADKFLELAKSAKADFAPVLGAVTDMMKEASEWALGPFLEEFEVSPAPPRD